MRPNGPALCLALAALIVAACGPRSPSKTPEGLPRLDTRPEQRTSLGLTALSSGLALVRETRRVELVGGRQQLRFIGVSDEVIPESVRVGVAGGDPAITFEEQNYDADLVTPGRITEAAVGSRVRAFVRDAGDGDEEILEGILRSGPRGALIETEDGISELPPDARLVVEEMPAKLVSRPTLSWIVDASRGGEHDVEVTYLTRGISWRADYVVDLDQEGLTARVQGWATVDNVTALTLKDARLQLLAGDVNRVEEVLRLEPTMIVGEEMDEAMPMSAPLPEEEALFEYHLYTVGRPLTMGAKQQKQVALVAAEGVPFDVTHLARLRLAERTVDLTDKSVLISLDHDREGPMAVPLPGGRAVLWIVDPTTGQRIQMGEHLVEHTPVGEPLELENRGNPAFRGEWIPATYITDDEGAHLVTGELTVANHRADTTPVELELSVSGDPRVTLEVTGMRTTPIGIGSWGIALELSPGEEKKLTVRTRR